MRSIFLVLLMGFFGLLFGCSKSSTGSPERYVSEAAFRENLSNQRAMDGQTIAELRKHGVTDATNLKLEFFFYTDMETKAQGLVKELQALGYKVEHKPSIGDSRAFVVRN
jgi:Regulator of ribonuclease activity B